MPNIGKHVKHKNISYIFYKDLNWYDKVGKLALRTQSEHACTMTAIYTYIFTCVQQKTYARMFMGRYSY